jgi:hypothetical protein
MEESYDPAHYYSKGASVNRPVLLCSSMCREITACKSQARPSSSLAKLQCILLSN